MKIGYWVILFFLSLPLSFSTDAISNSEPIENYQTFEELSELCTVETVSFNSTEFSNFISTNTFEVFMRNVSERFVDQQYRDKDVELIADLRYDVKGPFGNIIYEFNFIGDEEEGNYLGVMQTYNSREKFAKITVYLNRFEKFLNPLNLSQSPVPNTFVNKLTNTVLHETVHYTHAFQLMGDLNSSQVNEMFNLSYKPCAKYDTKVSRFHPEFGCRITDDSLQYYYSLVDEAAETQDIPSELRTTIFFENIFETFDLYDEPKYGNEIIARTTALCLESVSAIEFNYTYPYNYCNNFAFVQGTEKQLNQIIRSLMREYYKETFQISNTAISLDNPECEYYAQEVRDRRKAEEKQELVNTLLGLAGLFGSIIFAWILILGGIFYIIIRRFLRNRRPPQ